MPGQVYTIHVPVFPEGCVNTIQDHRRADCTYSGTWVPQAPLTPVHRLNPTNTQQPTSNVTSPMVFLIRPRKASRLHTQTAACLVRVYCYNTRRISSCNSVTDAWHFLALATPQECSSTSRSRRSSYRTRRRDNRLRIS